MHVVREECSNTVEAHCHVVELEMGRISKQFTLHRSQYQDLLASRAFFSCYTEVLQSDALISTALGDVMTGVDGLGG